MTSETQAVVINAPGEVTLKNVGLRTPGGDDVVIETEYTSISAGTERMLLAGQMPHPMLQLPVVPGYETVGRITAVGKNVSSEWQNQLVYVGGAQCYEDVKSAWGGQAARLFTNVGRVVPLNGIQPRHGVLLALTATALHGVDLLGKIDGQRILVLGQGPVGQIAARLVRQKGAWTAVADRNGPRLARSEADEIINVRQDLLSDSIEEPVNIIIEATGSMEALADALSLLAPGGLILLLGYYQQIYLPYMPLFLKEARILIAKEWASGDLVRSRDLIASGKLNIEPLLTHERPVREISEAYDQAINDLDCLKLVLNWK